MLINILKAFLIGICASVPLGPTAIFILQVSLSKGHKPGFITGLGATTVDTLFATISIFALSYARKFIDAHNTLILIVGGLVVALIGSSIIFKDPFRRLNPGENTSNPVKDYLKAVALGLSNPTVIFIMMTLFAFFDVRIAEQASMIVPVILALAAGSASYWMFYSGVFGHLRRNFKLSTIVWINRIAGIVVTVVGIVLFAEGCMKQFMN